MWTAQNCAINTISRANSDNDAPAASANLLVGGVNVCPNSLWHWRRAAVLLQSGREGVGKLVVCYQYERWRRRANLAAAADALGWWRCIAAEMAELCPNLAEMVELSESSS